MPRKKKVTDEQILSAARACFEEQGAGVSVDVIARSLGVTAPVLFMRFGSKLQLFYRSVLPAQIDVTEVMGDLSAGPDARPMPAQVRDVTERLIRLSSHMLHALRTIARHPVAMEAVLDLIEAPWPPAALASLTRWLTIGRASGLLCCDDPQFHAAFWLGAVYSQVMMAHRADPDEAERLLDRLADPIARSIWSGMAARIDPAPPRDRPGPAAPRHVTVPT